MFSFVRHKLNAARTLTSLCEAAEVEARREGQAQPGAEHFVLAALSLPDGKAARVFEALGLTDALLREAIARQYREPLHALGISGGTVSEPLAEANESNLYRAAPSGQALVQALGRGHKKALTSELVLVAAAEQSEGVFPRALAVLGLDPGQLRTAALASPVAKTA